MDILAEIIGWGGTGLLLVAYYIVSTRDRPPSALYQWFNGVGAFALCVNGSVHHAWPSVGLNVVWFIVAVSALTRHYRRRRLTPSNEEGREAQDQTV